MTQINEINTDLVEGKLLMAALAKLTTSIPYARANEIKTLEEVLTEVSEAADGMFVHFGLYSQLDSMFAEDDAKDPVDNEPAGDVAAAVETIINETF